MENLPSVPAHTCISVSDLVAETLCPISSPTLEVSQKHTLALKEFTI